MYILPDNTIIFFKSYCNYKEKEGLSLVKGSYRFTNGGATTTVDTPFIRPWSLVKGLLGHTKTAFLRLPEWYIIGGYVWCYSRLYSIFFSQSTFLLTNTDSSEMAASWVLSRMLPSGYKMTYNRSQTVLPKVISLFHVNNTDYIFTPTTSEHES